MQPILLIAGLAVGAGLISTGFLAGTNTFEVWIQDLGFGEGAIESPLEHVNVDFEVTKILADPTPNADGTSDGSGDEFYKNNITACSFHTFEPVTDGTDVICKLFSWKQGSTGTSIEDRVVVCEGRYVFGPNGTNDPSTGTGNPTYVPSSIRLIQIQQEAYVGACEVQNIDFVKIVAIGEEPFSTNSCENFAPETHFVDSDGDDMIEPFLGECVANTCGDDLINTVGGVLEICDDGALNGTTGFCNATCDGPT